MGRGLHADRHAGDGREVDAGLGRLWRHPRRIRRNDHCRRGLRRFGWRAGGRRRRWWRGAGRRSGRDGRRSGRRGWAGGVAGAA